MPKWLRSGVVLALWPVAVAFITPLLLNEYWVSIGVGIGAFAAAAVALSLLVRLAGQLSLAQGSFLGFGMYAVAKSPWGEWGGIAVVVVCALALSLALGLLLLRLRHFYFALGTLAAGLVMEGLARGYPDDLGGPSGLAVANTPPLGLVTPTDYFHMMWVLVAIVLTGATLVRWSRFGRAAEVLGHVPELAAAVGVRPLKIRIALFMFASTTAALAGAFYGHFLLFVSPPALGIGPNIELLVGVALGGAEAGASVIGASLVGLLPQVGVSLAKAQRLILGLVLVVLVLAFPDGLRLPGRGGWWRRRTQAEVPPPTPIFEMGHSPPPASFPEGCTGGLVACDVAISFGGLRAVDGVDFTVRPGEIVGLIGPNGAGKTTLFNLLAGSLRPDRGMVELGGIDVTSWSAERRAAAGLARTFQIPRAVPRSTALDTTIIGGHRLGSSGMTRGLLGLEHDERRRLEAGALQALDRVGLADLARRPVETLGTGRRKLLEVARALAAEPHVLLLDEPASGLEADEADRLSELVRSIADDGVAIALVEHGMDFVMNLCDVVVVLEQGRVIARDLPTSVRENPEVLRAYLG